jgi:hypothetical protein
MLLINRFTNPNTKLVFTQAHELDQQLQVIKSYPKMTGDDISLFDSYDNILISDVAKSSMLAIVTIKNGV